jgi:hypothetical protein
LYFFTVFLAVPLHALCRFCPLYGTVQPLVVELTAGRSLLAAQKQQQQQWPQHTDHRRGILVPGYDSMDDFSNGRENGRLPLLGLFPLHVSAAKAYY